MGDEPHQIGHPYRDAVQIVEEIAAPRPRATADETAHSLRVLRLMLHTGMFDGWSRRTIAALMYRLETGRDRITAGAALDQERHRYAIVAAIPTAVALISHFGFPRVIPYLVPIIVVALYALKGLSEVARDAAIVQQATDTVQLFQKIVAAKPLDAPLVRVAVDAEHRAEETLGVEVVREIEARRERERDR